MVTLPPLPQPVPILLLGLPCLPLGLVGHLDLPDGRNRVVQVSSLQYDEGFVLRHPPTCTPGTWSYSQLSPTLWGGAGMGETRVSGEDNRRGVGILTGDPGSPIPGSPGRPGGPGSPASPSGPTKPGSPWHTSGYERDHHLSPIAAPTPGPATHFLPFGSNDTDLSWPTLLGRGSR